MKVGDLVKIKYDGVVALITKVETPDGNVWVHLLGQPVPFRTNRLEVINASR